jgi:hypothetical protein
MMRDLAPEEYGEENRPSRASQRRRRRRRLEGDRSGPTDLSDSDESTFSRSTTSAFSTSTSGSTPFKKKNPSNKVDIPLFSGETGKYADTTYKAWKYVVQGYLERYSDRGMLPHVKNSLRGPPTTIIMSANVTTTAELLASLDEYYATVDNYDTMCTKLQNLKQGYNEKVVEFAVRLDEQIFDIKVAHPGRMSPETENELRRSRFYGGLTTVLRNALSHTQNKPRGERAVEYVELLQLARQLEGEQQAQATRRDYAAAKRTSKPAYTSRPAATQPNATVRAAAAEPDGGENQENPSGSAGEGTDVDEDLIPAGMEDQFPGILARVTQAMKQYQKENGLCYKCSGDDHLARDCPQADAFRKALNGSGGAGKGSQAPARKEKRDGAEKKTSK